MENLPPDDISVPMRNKRNRYGGYGGAAPRLIQISAEVSSKLSMKVVRLRKSALFYCIVVVAIPAMCFFNYYHIYSVRRKLGADSVIGTLPQIKERLAHQGGNRLLRFRDMFVVQSSVPFNISRYTASNFTGLLTTTLEGNLAEQMFQLACTHAIATANKLQTAVTPGSQLMKFLRPSVAQVILPMHYVRPLTIGGSSVERNLTEIGDAYNTLVGRLRSWRYLAPYENETKRFFVFNAHVVRRASAILDSLYRRHDRRKFAITVGVHVARHGKSLLSVGKPDTKPPTVAFLASAMNRARKKYSRPLFVVATDDRKWSAENIVAADGDVAYVDLLEGHRHERTMAESERRLVEMYTVSRCNHTIITDGVFGWWAAFLSDGEKVYPKVTDDDDDDASLRTAARDIYPDSWTPLS
ncbi:PREDICTED: galactoside 2-alpha-L-fucosyltransferase 2-like [Priapulus caudatus]|uniref:L-Fucosyltransferase n=1 Tax=Priapulus caudatus TaxID=37621 RepID=A0ABM1F1B4_PRICU|nr:PREDICTED: galactoside 2-alpha-L-fucosyltransferase 2-like [Priapulus caudatus]